MNITNKHGLPEAFHRVAVKLRGGYSKGTAFASATELLRGAKQFWLSRRHADEIQVDVADLIWAMRGTALHDLLQKGAGSNDLSEERLSVGVLGKKITGQFDMFTENGELLDWKETSAWKIVYREFSDWETQLNIYAYLLIKAGFEVKSIAVFATLRDWSKLNATRNRDYPQASHVHIPLSLWSLDFTEKYLAERIQYFLQYESAGDDSIPACSPEERWAKADEWAVMKEGRKTAVRVFDAEKDANGFLEGITKDADKHSITKRPGIDNKCAAYCDVAPFCSYWKEKYGAGEEGE